MDGIAAAKTKGVKFGRAPIKRSENESREGRTYGQKVIQKKSKRGKLLLKDQNEYSRMAEACNPYGDGEASRRIIQAILYHYGLTEERPDAFTGSNV